MKLLISIMLLIPSSGMTQNAIKFLLSDHNTEIETFKFYVSNVRVTFEDKSQLMLEEPAYLIDFEETNEITLVMKSDKKISSIDFILGTDSMLNVAGILGGDLDPILGMYWAWNTGYINLKLEGKDKSGAFEYHVGGYLSPFSTHRHIHISSNEIIIDVERYINSASKISRQIMIPGKEASLLADLFPLLFKGEE